MPCMDLSPSPWNFPPVQSAMLSDVGEGTTLRAILTRSVVVPQATASEASTDTFSSRVFYLLVPNVTRNHH